ncbi:hypothetical protein [Calorimonas adulescens]|uniref:DUF1189 domain-containing protein n=1 Tax=Calorimonas adulescens TaxID=2606906 RepID=A0A5D8Q8C6_9THEO|nr:hypothetical protein [Calorimonas adulescens]TZE80637.1 hypothetical protein FWJ32_12705 [Calorimonas adulescens]
MKRLILIFILVLLVPTVALAKGEGSDVVSTDRVIIEENEEADNVVVLFNNAVIDGRVHDSVFVIMGSVDIGSDARIDGNLMVIGGDINAPRGFKAGHGIYHINLKDKALNEFLLSIIGFAGIEFARLFFMCLFMVVPVLIGIAFPGWTGRAVEKLLNVRRAMGLGIILFLILVTVVLIMIFTVIGIPVAAFLSVITAVFMVLGFSVSSSYTGRVVLERMGYNTGGFMVPLVGSIILSAFSSIPIIGVILLIIFSAAGMGAIVENLIKA